LPVASCQSVSALAVGPEQIVVFQEQVSFEQFSSLKDEFDQLTPQERYRGKFNLLFFMRWLELLAADRASEQSVHFDRLSSAKGVNTGGITIAMLASKSEAPKGFKEFLESVH